MNLKLYLCQLKGNKYISNLFIVYFNYIYVNINFDSINQ